MTLRWIVSGSPGRIAALGLCLLAVGCGPAPTDPSPATATAAASTDQGSGATAAPSGSPSSPSPVPAANAAVGRWRCGDLLAETRLQDDALVLLVSGRTLRLHHVESFTGARYADDPGNAFMVQGGRAVLTLAGEPQHDCTPTGQRSPWAEAADKGVAFRAVGNEPGWVLELGPGTSPRLDATLDYGQRQVTVAQMQPTGNGFRGTSLQDEAVELQIRRDTCHDGMSGIAFEATAQLRVGDSEYRGCGAFLDD